jgi:hypothetical protein
MNELQRQVEKMLVDGLSVNLKSSIDSLARQGQTAAQIIAFVRKCAGGRNMTVTGVEVYLRDKSGEQFECRQCLDGACLTVFQECDFCGHRGVQAG